MQDENSVLPEYLTPTQTSAITGFSLRALESMRAKRTGPIYIKIGKAKNGPIRYRLMDIHDWMQSHVEVANAGQ